MEALLIALAAIVGRYVYEGIQVAGTFVDKKLPTVVHALALVTVQFGLLELGQFFNMAFPKTLGGFTAELSIAVVSALFAMGWHALSKKK